MHVSQHPEWAGEPGNACFWDRVCLIFAVVCKWKKVIFETDFIWELNVRSKSKITTRFCSGAGSQCNDIQSSYFIFLRCVESSTVISVLSSFVKVTHCYHLASGTYTIGCHLHTIKFDERVHMRWIVVVKARNLMEQHGKFGANGGLLFYMYKLRSVS